jgi:hypothetical protein
MRALNLFAVANYLAFVYGGVSNFLVDLLLQQFSPTIDKKELFNPVRLIVQICSCLLCFAAHADYVQWWIAMDEFRNSIVSWKISIRVYFGLLLVYVYGNHLMTESILIMFREMKYFSGLRLFFIGPTAILVHALSEEMGMNYAVRRLLLVEL